ncbi:MAG: NEW3 domain-containing protein [Patescibacteria group bacterium]
MTKINLMPKKSWKTKAFKALSIVAQVTLIFQMSYLGVFFAPKTAEAAATSLTTNILSWHILGVDSNSPVTDGPHKFLIQARIANTGALPATGVQTNFAFGSGTANAYLSLVSNAAFPLNTINSGAHKDVFYVVQVTPPATPNSPSNPVFDTSRPFTITATSPDSSNASASQTLYIEHILSQSRNHILSSTVIPANPLVGQPFTVHVEYETASTYLDITPQMTYNPAVATLDSVTTHYVTDGVDENDIYSQDHGNIIHSDFHFRAQSAGTLSFYYTVLDHSGSSFHYNDDFSDAIIVPVTPRQNLEKSVDKATATPGETITYTLKYFNTGNIDLTNVVITDTYDSHFTFTSSNPAPSVGNNVWNIGTLPVAAGGTITITGTLTGVFPAGTTKVHNLAVMTSDQVAPVQATADTTVTAVCDLNIIKSVDKATASVGDTLTYTLRYENTGNTKCTGTGVKVYDPLDTYLTYVTGSKHITITNDGGNLGTEPGQGDDYNGKANILLYNVREVVSGEYGVITFQATVNTPTVCGDFQIPNKGKIWSNETAYIWSNEVKTDIHMDCYGSVSGYKFNDLDKDDNNKETGEPGLPDWEICLLNVNTKAEVCTTTDANGYYKFTSVPFGSYQLYEKQQTGWTQSYPLEITNPGQDYNFTLASPVDLTGKNFGNYRNSGNLTLVKEVINNNGGTAVATNWTLSATGPTPISGAGGVSGTVIAGTYALSESAGPAGYQASAWNCIGGSQTGNDVTINDGDSATCKITNDDIQPKLTVTKIVVNDNGGTAVIADFPLFVNATSVTSGVQNGFNAGAYTVSETNKNGYTGAITGDCAANGSVTLNAGDVKTCTITNDDISGKISGYKLDDQGNKLNGWEICYTKQDLILPDQLSVQITQPICVLTGDGDWPDGYYEFTGLYVGDYVVFENLLYGWTQLEPQGGVHNITVQSGTDSKDNNFVNRLNDFNVEIVKSAPATVNAGENLTYTLDWTVTGNTPVNNVIISDVLPANTTYVSGGDNYDSATNTVSWNLGTVNPTDNGTVSFTVKVNSPLYNGTIIDNEAEICGEAQLVAATFALQAPTQKCDDDDTSTTVKSGFNVDVDKDGPLTGKPGEQIDYTVVWSTSGNSPIDKLVITDNLPADTTFVSASNGGAENNGVITWDLGPQTPGVHGTFTVTVTLNSNLNPGNQVTNESEICAWVFEAPSGELMVCDKDDTTTLIKKPILAIEKTVDLVFANPGNVATYTVTITNTGNETAYNVVLTDTLPAGFTFVENGLDTKSWSLGDLVPADSVTVNYEVTVGKNVTAGFYDNFAEAKADNHGKIHDIASLEVRIPKKQSSEAYPILTIGKSVDKATVNPNTLVNYTVKIANKGEATAYNVILTDKLPAGFTFTDTGLGQKTWNLGNMTPGTSITLNYEVLVGKDVKSGDYKNLATVKADNNDPVSASVNVNVKQGAVLGLTGPKWYEIFYYLLGLLFVAGGIKAYRKINQTGETR